VTTGGLGGAGEKPQYSRDVHGDADFKVSQRMPYTEYEEEEGPYSNTKSDNSTPAKRVLAARKTATKARRLRDLLRDENEDIDYAAQGGLMGV
jgi:hypothetical protein